MHIEFFPWEKSHAYWESVGEIPLACACLNNQKVCFKLHDLSKEDWMQMVRVEIQQASNVA